MTIEEHDQKQWYKMGCLGPYNFHDFPLWIKWDWNHGKMRPPLFCRKKEDMELHCPDWETATHWRSAREHGPYRVLEDKFGRFWPQELIEGEWFLFHEGSSMAKSFSTLADAKHEIDHAIVVRSDRPDIIHPYP